MLICILQWLGSLLGILGAPLVASQRASVRRLGFGIWLGSNACLITWASATGAWGIVAMQAFFSWASWRGWRNNGEAQP